MLPSLLEAKADRTVQLFALNFGENLVGRSLKYVPGLSVVVYWVARRVYSLIPQFASQLAYLQTFHIFSTTPSLPPPPPPNNRSLKYPANLDMIALIDKAYGYTGDLPSEYV